MNSTAAICAAFLRGETLTIKTAFDKFGVSNLPREVGRSVERKFGVYISKIRMSGKSRYKIPCSWYEYRLNPLIKENKEGVGKMIEYCKQHFPDFENAKTEKQKKQIKQINQLSLL